VQVVPSLFATHQDGQVTYGLGVYSYMGMSFDLGDQWSGRRVIENAGLKTFNIAPAVAWSPTDKLRFGASVAAQRAEYEAGLAVSSDATYFGPPAGLPDGRVELEGDSWGLGGQLGVQLQASDELQLGLAWTAPVDHSAPGDITASGVHPVLATLLPADGATTLNFTVPQQLLFGAAYQATPATTLLLGLGWQDWSAFGDAKLKMPGQVSAMFPGGLRDAWGASLGVRHAFGEHWTAAAGIDYESDPSRNRGVPAYFPVAEQWRIAAGVERPVGEACRLRLSLSVIDQGQAKVVQVSNPLPLPGVKPLNGTYETARIYLLGLAADFSL
jgi:long-chain fatty acid transport protein